MNKVNKSILILISVFSLPLLSLAEGSKNGVKIEGRKSSVINNSVIRLSDIADISSGVIQDDETVIALQKIQIDPAPQPGEESTITASRILERLKEEGVRLSEVLYTLPRVISISRASRILTKGEVEAALRSALKDSGKELNIKHVNYNENIKVPPAFGKLKAGIFSSSKPGEIAFSLSGSVDGDDERKFEMSAQVDQWVNIPIAGSFLPKGNKITKEDIVMARMNAATLQQDTFHNADEIIGKEVTTDIQYGESFRKNKINVPAAILAGSKVILYYKVGALEASATGIAQEAGIIGQEIKVKNESSKKIIVGKIIEPGKVGVNQ